MSRAFDCVTDCFMFDYLKRLRLKLFRIMTVTCLFEYRDETNDVTDENRLMCAYRSITTLACRCMMHAFFEIATRALKSNGRVAQMLPG